MAKYENKIINQVIISGEAEIEKLRNKLIAARDETDNVNAALERTTGELNRIKMEFADLEHSKGIDILKEELRRFKDTAHTSVLEFQSFLESVNLNDIAGSNDWQFREFFDQIRNGSMTASEAITRIKTEFAALLTDNYNRSGGLFDSQVVQQFTVSLDKLGETMDTVLSKVSAIETGGVKVAGGTSGGGNDISDVLEKIEKAAHDMTAEVKDSYTSITTLIQAMNDYGNLDETKLLGVSQAFSNIAAIGKGSYGTKSIDNIVRLAQQLNALGGSMSSIRFDFTGLNNLKVSKASMSNLATYLPQIAAVNAKRLEALSHVDLTNFNNVKVSKGAMESIANLSEAIKVLNETRAATVRADENSIDIDIKQVTKTAKTQYEDSKRAIKEYYSTLNMLNKTKGHDIVLESDGFKSLSGNYDKLAESLNGTKTAYDLVINSMRSMTAEQQTNIQTLKAQLANQYDITSERQANKERIKAEAEAERRAAEITKQAIKEKAEAAKQAAKEKADANRQEAEAAKQSEKVAKTKLKIEELIAKVQSNSMKWSKAEHGKSIDDFKKYVDIIDDLNKLKKDKLSMAPDDFIKRFKELSDQAEEYASHIKFAGENTSSFLSRIKDLTSKFAGTFTATRIVMFAVRSLKQMYHSFIEIENSMVQLKIVTNATDIEMESFLTRSIGLAKELGKNVTEIVSSIETFSRLGYNLEDASELAKYANILANVADTDVSKATEGLTSIIKGYGMDISESEHVADVLVDVGRKYAISAEELMEAFQRGGAALYASGTDFEKSAALFAATNAALQNSSVVGTLWKVVSARIRGATTELEEMGEETEGLAAGLSKYRDEIKALSGVDIMIDEKTYKDTYDIFVELASVWDKMSGDPARARVAEILGGKRQYSGIMSTITNIKDAVNAYEDAINSTGAATKANNVYMETTTAHLKQMGASFQELSYDVFNSDLIKNSVDIFSEILDLIDAIVDKTGTLPVVLGSVGTVMAIKHVASAVKEVKKYKDSENPIKFAESVRKEFSNVIKLVDDAKGIVKASTDAFTAAWNDPLNNGISKFVAFGKAAKEAGASLSAFAVSHPVATIIAAAVAIYGIVKAVDALTESFDEAKEKAAESKEKYEITANEVSSLESKLKEVKARMEEIKSIGTLNITDQAEYDKLKAQNEQLEYQLEIKQKLADYERQQAAEDAANVLTKQVRFGYGISNPYQRDNTATYIQGDIIKRAEYNQKKLNEVQTEYNNLLAEQSTLTPEYSEGFFDHLTDYEKNEIELKSLKDEMKSLNNVIQSDLINIDEYGNALLDSNGNVLSGFEDVYNRVKVVRGFILDSARKNSDGIKTAAEKATEAAKEAVEAITDLEKKFKGFADYQDIVTSALKSSKSATGLTTEEIDKLIAVYKNLEGFDAPKLFEETANGIHLNSDELERLNRLYEENRLDEITEQIKELHYEIYNQRAKGNDTSALEEELIRVELLKNQYEGMTSAYNDWLKAKSGGKERDSYKSVGAAYEEMQKTLNQGWYGDESLNKWLDLILGKSEGVRDTVKDFEKLNETIEGTDHSIMDYWRYDEDDKLVSDGLIDFLDDVNSKLGEDFATIKDGKYAFDFDGDKLQKVADAFGISTEMVELFERAMIDAGVAIDLSDLSLPEKIDKFRESLKKLQESEEISSDLNLEFNVDTDKLEDVKTTIDGLKNERLKIDPEINPGAALLLDELIEKCERQYYFRLNAETDGSLNEAVWIVEHLKTLTAAPLTVEARVANEDEIQSLAEKLAALPPSVQIAVGIKEENTGNTSAIIQQLNNTPESINIPVNFEKGKEPKTVKNAKGKADYEIGEYPTTIPQHAKGIVDYEIGKYPTTIPIHAKGNVDYSNYFPPSPYQGGKRGRAYGTTGAYTTGQNWSLLKNEDALVNELGTESMVRDGKWFPIPGGAHIEQLKKGDIIFSAEQTRELLRTGRIVSGGGHGKTALVDGTACNTLNLSAYDSGSGFRRRADYGNSTAYKNHVRKDSSGSNVNYSSKDSSDDLKENSKEIFDFIEIAINRIERIIKRLGMTAESVFKKLQKRLSATDDKLSEITNEIELQQAAYRRYIEESENVGLSSDLAARVRDGAIDISEYDKETAELIQNYQKWYEQALKCSDAIDELHENLSSLYKDRFEVQATDFENQLSLLEHATNTYDKSMDKIEEQGYLISSKYYSAMRGTENEKIKIQKNELKVLTEAMSQAINSGAIEEQSEAWYDFQQKINGVKEAIQESEAAMVKFSNSIREVEWEHFDYLQDRIASIIDESEFLISLMSNSKMHNDKGQLTKEGNAMLGLHGQNYNVDMAQANKYADEIRKINAEMANDPSNTKLIKRREELLGLQRDSILAAEEEKQAIIDLAKEGIDIALDSFKELIGKYEDALDKERDLFEYQKKVEDQTSDIAKLRKQIGAYTNDNSEEVRATIQKLNVDLSEAEERLAETQYERFIKDQTSLLDELSAEYESLLNQRIDDTDALLADMISVINSEATNINETLIAESDKVGYTISENLKSVWAADGNAYGVITKYGDSFDNALTTVNSVLNSISTSVAKMVGKSDEGAENAITGVALSTPANAPKPMTEPTSAPATTTAPSNTPTIREITIGGKINAGNAPIYEYVGDNSGERQYYGNDPIYTVLGEQGGYLLVRHHSLSGGYTGWFKKSDVKAYRSGGLINYTGLAWVDGNKNKPESFLNAEDTKNISALRDVLREVANGSLKLDDIFFGNSKPGILNRIDNVSALPSVNNTSIGDISYQINIPIEHVADYNDFTNQLRKDDKFEKFIQSVTIDRMVGGGKLSKNKYKW